MWRYVERLLRKSRIYWTTSMFQCISYRKSWAGFGGIWVEKLRFWDFSWWLHNKMYKISSFQLSRNHSHLYQSVCEWFLWFYIIQLLCAYPNIVLNFKIFKSVIVLNVKRDNIIYRIVNLGTSFSCVKEINLRCLCQGEHLAPLVSKGSTSHHIDNHT